MYIFIRMTYIHKYLFLLQRLCRVYTILSCVVRIVMINGICLQRLFVHNLSRVRILYCRDCLYTICQVSEFILQSLFVYNLSRVSEFISGVRIYTVVIVCTLIISVRIYLLLSEFILQRLFVFNLSCFRIYIRLSEFILQRLLVYNLPSDRIYIAGIVCIQFVKCQNLYCRVYLYTICRGCQNLYQVSEFIL